MTIDVAAMRPPCVGCSASSAAVNAAAAIHAVGVQALGVAVELSPASVSSCIEQTRLGFMYAPYYHPVMKSVKAVRSALQVGVSTYSIL